MTIDLADSAIDYDPDADGWIYMLYILDGSIDPDLNAPSPEDISKIFRGHYYIGKTKLRNYYWPNKKRRLNRYLLRQESEIHEEMDNKLKNTPVTSIATGGR